MELSQVDIWFQDEARIGQRGTVSRVWAQRGTRPRLKRQQKNEFAYVFGAICPATSQAVGLVMPYSNAKAMQHHLNEIAKAVPTARHAVIVMDRAAWHTTKKLTLPHNISLLHLPALSPELNPVEQVWNWLRQHHWANRVFENYDAIVHACCQAWNAFAALPKLVKSIGNRIWTRLHKQKS
jgi:transposase